MSYETGTFSTPKALFDNIVAKLQSTAFMGAGNEWVLKYSCDGYASSDVNMKKAIASFLCPGPSGLGDFHIALRIEPSTGVNTTNFLFGALKEGAVPLYGGATWSDAGDWSSSSVSYRRGQVAKHSSTYYVCDVDHTSSAGITPGLAGGAGYWVPLASTPDWMGTFMSASNWHTQGCGKVWNGGPGDITCWLMANASRVMFVTKSDT
ncbi:MAG: hypothetical protein ACREU4_13140, partial [Burkholderiales bacterium]